MATIPAPRPVYVPDSERYDGRMPYRRCGNTGLVLPALTLGFWWNFGEIDTFASCQERVFRAFDQGITAFDLANNYGPPFGAAEETFGKIFRQSLRPYRHEMVITTKAGHEMWHGPYGNCSSRKMLMTSIDESLARMGLDYVDIFYSHRYDGVTPVEETMQALVDIVHAGKALYVGLSKYPVDKMEIALKYLHDAHVPAIIYQEKSNMLVDDLTPEHSLLLDKYGMGYTAFSPLQQGLLSAKYIDGIPADSRAGMGKYISADNVTPKLIERLRRLNDIAARRNQSLSQLAIAWLLAKPVVTSVIIGPRTLEQLDSCLGALSNIEFTPEELDEINSILQ